MIQNHVLRAASYEQVMASVKMGFFDILHTGFSLIDKQGNFSYCNPAFIHMYDLPPNVIGRKVREFFPVEEGSVLNNRQDHKMAVSLEESTNRVCGIIFNYSIYDHNKEFCGMVIESVPCNLGKERLPELLESMDTLEMTSFPREISKKPQPQNLDTFGGMIGQSDAMRMMRVMGQRFASSDEPVLVTGESGTGKELVAKALHNASQRSREPFVCVNCAALAPSLIESELFGYEGGSFTGARQSGMKGKFEQANGGTIFLDEIGELPLDVQAKLLRVLENGEVQKIGSNKVIHSNFRLVGATNRDLLQMVRQGKFREDLYHRLCVFELTVPPLREREDDIFLLTRFYLDQYLADGQKVWLDPEMETVFRNYTWPGNIRELKNTIVYALYAIGSGQQRMGVQHLPQRLLKSLGARQPQFEKQSTSTPRETLRASEKQVLLSTLERLRYNKALTARELGISRSTLYRLLNKYGVAD